MTRIETAAARKWRIWNREGVRALAELCRPKPGRTPKAGVLERNVLWTHTADMIASQIMGLEELGVVLTQNS